MSGWVDSNGRGEPGRTLPMPPYFYQKPDWLKPRSKWAINGVLAMTLSACAGTPIVTASASSCSALLPPNWVNGVPGAPLPDGESVGDWISFADAQTGRLDQANGRTRDAIEIVQRCEARDANAVKRATRRKFLGLL